MMKLFVFLKSVLTKNILLALAGTSVAVFSFQNCSQTKFTSLPELTSSSLADTAKTPFCSLETRPSHYEQVACLPPQQNTRLAIQFYDVICQDSGQWTRFPRGDVNYSPCFISCNQAERPSDFENIFCPAPFENEKNGVQEFSVQCGSNGKWTRTLKAADYSLCSKSCDPDKKPLTTSPMACPAPFNSIISGVQNYAVTCEPNGTWSRRETSTDYRACPQSCDPAKRPTEREVAACPSTGVMNAFQNYTVTCNHNGTWDRIPSTLDSSKCATPTCDAGAKPNNKENVFCPAPHQDKKLALQNYTVTCSGTNWTRTAAGAADTSACPKTCAGPVPANDSSAVSCQSPFESQSLAVQNYKYVCNSATGQYDRTIDGVVNYAACPKSCTGTKPPATVLENSCPAGTTGQAIRNYTVTCDPMTGQYKSVMGSLDTSSCVQGSCSLPKPAEAVAESCPAPFTDRKDAIKNFKVSCEFVNGNYIWSSNYINTDTSSCPVNDCSGSSNPGNEKVIGACGGGAQGSIYQTCSLSCTGNTYTQVNCSANNYSRCDCGPNSTYNPTTKICVADAATCVEGSRNLPAVSCGAGYAGGTKYQVERTTCPSGPYGTPVVITDSNYVTTRCESCPSATTRSETPTCGANQTAVRDSKVYTTTYSCATGVAVPTERLTSSGTCNNNPATCAESSSPETVACGAGYNGGTKTRTVTTSCPSGPYGSPSTNYLSYNTSQCVTCPGTSNRVETPSCSANEIPVVNSKVIQTSYSCATGRAVSSETVLNYGTCNPKPVTCTPSESTSLPALCGGGMTGTKTTTTTVTCPQGSYGPPSTTSVENTQACQACPQPHDSQVTPSCPSGFTAVANSQTMRTTYSCSTGVAVASTNPVNSGACQPVAVTPKCVSDVFSWVPSRNSCVGKYETDICLANPYTQRCSPYVGTSCIHETGWNDWYTYDWMIDGVNHNVTTRERCTYYIWAPIGLFD